MSSETKWEVGDRCQWVETNSGVFAGVITGLSTDVQKVSGSSGWGGRPVEMETYVSHVTVKWDDGEEETLDRWKIQPEDSPLEREFRLKAPEILKQIQDNLELATDHLDQAEAIAEEHGIPFPSNISPLSQNYLARSFKKKWPDVSKDVVDSVTETYAEGGEYYGWQHSAVC